MTQGVTTRLLPDARPRDGFVDGLLNHRFMVMVPPNLFRDCPFSAGRLGVIWVWFFMRFLAVLGVEFSLVFG